MRLKRVAWAIPLLAMAILPALWRGQRLLAEGGGESPGPFPPTRVATVDMGRVFKQYQYFLDRTAEFKQEVDAADKELREAQATLATDNAAALRDANSPEKLKEIEQRKAALETEVQEKRDAFLKREAELYLDAYRKVQHEISVYAKERGIHLVVRCSGDDTAPEAPADVLKMVNQNLVYQDGIEITDDVIELVNRADE